MRRHVPLLAAGLLAATVAPAPAARAQRVQSASFVNGLTIPGDALDLSDGSDFDRRLGFFSDLYYDRRRGEWWGLSDRGPGGGVLPYATRVQRFTLQVDGATGRISDYRVLETIKFTDAGVPLNGLAPAPSDVLGNAFDPEGLVVNPRNGHLLVSDEYGPSLYEFDRDGAIVRRYATPANLVPRDAATGTPNYAGNAGNTAGKASNRGFEGLAVSPDGRHAYAVLQSAMLDEGAGSGRYMRIVKFDTQTGEAVGQYLYELDTAGQGRGISAIVALGNERFLVLERNNRGLGVGATLGGADKVVYAVDLAAATDVSDLAVTGGVLPDGVRPARKRARVVDLDADVLPELGGHSPEKWEGLAVGPRLDDGRYLLLAGTDNDYSVTQSGTGTQFDVWLDFSLADPYASSIQCPLGETTGCVFTTGGQPATLTAAYALLPGVLHAYTARIDGYRPPTTVPEPATLALTALGAAALGALRARRRPDGGA